MSLEEYEFVDSLNTGNQIMIFKTVKLGHPIVVVNPKQRKNEVI